MFILKLALLTCAFYIGVTSLLQAAILLLAHAYPVFIRYNRLRFGFLFGVIWFISFSFAWHIVYAALKAKLPATPH